MKKTCPICGKTFTLNAKHPDTICCSRKCGARNRFKHASKDNLTCECCGKIFQKSHNPNRPITRFCSRKCYDAYRTESRGLCLQCGGRLPPSRSSKTKFCSQDCRNLYLRAKPRPCINCGVEFTPVKYHKSQNRYSSNNAGKTCSAKCENEWIRNNPERKRKISIAFTGSKHPLWQGGKTALTKPHI